MISSENLEMNPPILVREKTFGWYPPAYDQFSKAPYKSMAVLDDYSFFKTNDYQCKNTDEKPITETVVENGGSVLSSKLNTIRKDLTRRRIDPTIIRQYQSKKYESLNHYMNIPPDWKPKFPKPDFESFQRSNVGHSAPVTKESYCSMSEERNSNINIPENKPENNLTNNPSQFPKSLSSNLIEQQKQTEMKRNFTKQKLQRPHTAPEYSLQLSVKMSPQRHQVSNTPIFKDSKSINDKQFHLNKQLSQSQSRLPNETYQSDIEKYKWMMEIPGDPFNIKQPHIPVKQPYFQKIEDCQTLIPEPRIMKQNRNTFFQNTLPCRTMSFEIDPNFSSEKYNAMKNALRSQGKWNYSSKNLSFVY